MNTQQPEVLSFRSLKSLSKKLRKDLKGTRRIGRTPRQSGRNSTKSNDFVLIFAHNGVGKTRLSMAFKDAGKRNITRKYRDQSGNILRNKSGEAYVSVLKQSDTLYFNAFTEDLFDWDNDLDNDSDRVLRFKSQSQFFNDLEGMGIEGQIYEYLHRYADFNFNINYEDAEIRFSREVIERGRSITAENIKISRGEENLFIWCFFLAILRLATEAEKGEPYDWVKYVYIDDPISSLDEHNAITIASDLAGVLKETSNDVKFIISTHHGLFFNVMFNELKGRKWTKANISKKAYILHRSEGSLTYKLTDTGESPFLHHVVALRELKAVAKTGEIYQHHFHRLRSILEKTAIFFGRQHISTCFDGLDKKELYTRTLNVKSHAKYSVFEPEPLHAEEKKMFKEILREFIKKYPFKI